MMLGFLQHFLEVFFEKIIPGILLQNTKNFFKNLEIFEEYVGVRFSHFKIIYFFIARFFRKEKKNGNINA